MVKYLISTVSALLGVAIVYWLSFDQGLTAAMGLGDYILMGMIFALLMGTSLFILGNYQGLYDYKPIEQVYHPAHYNLSSIELIDVVWPLSFCQGNAVKYLARAGYKGDYQEDIDKAWNYLNYAKEHPGWNVDLSTRIEWDTLNTLLDEREDLSSGMKRVIRLTATGSIQQAQDELEKEEKGVH